jgi:hypothetical protein
MKKNLLQVVLSFLVLLMSFGLTYSQGVTTSGLSGKVVSNTGESLPGALVVSVHSPSGTKYSAVTNNEGRYFIPNMRVGGPYNLSVSFIGYTSFQSSEIMLSLGLTTNINVELKEETLGINEVVVVGEKNPVFSSERTGASTGITNQNLNKLPLLLTVHTSTIHSVSEVVQTLVVEQVCLQFLWMRLNKFQ